MAALYGISMDSAEIVHDLHPNYFSTGWASQFRCRSVVQHHHAHIAAVLFEHQLFESPCIGLAWDGTGYGADGTVWGGECLRATCTNYQRVGWLRPLPLLGGETSGTRTMARCGGFSKWCIGTGGRSAADLA